jgi:cell division protein FtsB
LIERLCRKHENWIQDIHSFTVKLDDTQRNEGANYQQLMSLQKKNTTSYTKKHEDLKQENFTIKTEINDLKHKSIDGSQR